MSAHTVIRFADWAIGPERAPGAPPVLHAMECTTCGAASEVTEEFEEARNWAFRHVGRNLSHTGYREIVHRFWRATLAR